MRKIGLGYPSQSMEGERRSVNSALWHACAGPLVSLPSVGTAVVYFPQGHTEQVAASMQKELESPALNYPNPDLPSCLTCHLHNLTLHADTETDEVYAQMTLQPLSVLQDKDCLLVQDPRKQDVQPTDFFCKTLTASDTSTHGGFSIPRKSAEKVFPPLDYNQVPPAQELVARDLHDQEWRFRHIYRGQPRRHLLTTGWSVFVSAKRLLAGDAVLFIRDDKGQLLLGIKRANRQQAPMPSSVVSTDSMHIGVLAAAAHAASARSFFTIFYNPRASPSEFVIPFAKYYRAAHEMQLSVGMRFRMSFVAEESNVRRRMGTITGISELDPVRWPNSMWRALEVGWDESTAGERQARVSAWEIQPVKMPFIMCPPPQDILLQTKCPAISRIHGQFAENCRHAASRHVSSIVLPTMRSTAGFFDSDLLQLSSAPASAPTSAGPLPLPGMPGRLQSGPRFISHGSAQYTSVLQSSQNSLQQQASPLSASSFISGVTHVNPSWIASLMDHNQGEVQVSSSQLARMDALSGGVDPFPISHGESSSQAGAALPALSSSSLEYRDEDQDRVQSDPRKHLLFGVSVESPLLGTNACSSPSSRVCGKESQHQMFTSTSGADLPLSPGVLSSGGICESSVLQLNSNWRQIQTPVRTYTKVVKLGSVGRSLDMSRLSGYEELRSELSRMFGMEGQLKDWTTSGWQLVFVDNEGDTLLVGDDPWEEFISCVRCIRILSPPEVDKETDHLCMQKTSEPVNGDSGKSN